MISERKHTPANDPDYFHALDGIRGLLALIVAIYHTAWASHIGHADLWKNGPAVVDIFFVLSGFIMYQLYDGRIKTKEDGFLYLKKRFARIYPLHFFMLIVMMSFAIFRVLAHIVGIAHLDPGEVLPFQVGAGDTLWAFFANLTLTHSMGVLSQLSYNVPSWSISVEFFAYIVFTWMVLFRRPTKAMHFAWICVGIAGIYAGLSFIKPNMDIHYDWGFFRCLGGFFTGVVASWALNHIRPKLKPTKAGALSPVSTILEAVTLIAMMMFISQATGKAQFFVAPVGFAFVLIFAFGRGLVSKLFSSRMAMYLGKISYSIYMVHIILAIVFGVAANKVLPRLLGEDWNETMILGDGLILGYLAVLVFVSHFTYEWIEVRGRKAIMAFETPAWLTRPFANKA